MRCMYHNVIESSTRLCQNKNDTHLLMRRIRAQLFREAIPTEPQFGFIHTYMARDAQQMK